MDRERAVNRARQCALATPRTETYEAPRLGAYPSPDNDPPSARRAVAAALNGRWLIVLAAVVLLLGSAASWRDHRAADDPPAPATTSGKQAGGASDAAPGAAADGSGWHDELGSRVVLAILVVGPPLLAWLLTRLSVAVLSAHRRRSRRRSSRRRPRSALGPEPPPFAKARMLRRERAPSPAGG